MPSLTAWRNAVFATFFAMGCSLASWLARVPHVRDQLDVTTGEMGLILLGISIGSVSGLLLASHILHAFGARRVIPLGMVIVGLGLGVAGWAADASLMWLLVAGFILGGSVIGITDVGMNLTGAAYERASGRQIMSLFHASFSLGTVAGAGLGGLFELLEIGIGWQATGIGIGIAALAAFVARAIPEEVLEENHEPVTLRERLSVWKDPRTLLLGLLVLGMSLTEGSANDWLALTMVDGHGFSNEGGAFVLALFLTAMTLGRVVGVPLLERFGRVAVLRATAALAAAGLLLVIVAEPAPLVITGVVLWGVGASLGFPVGMSAAADDPRLAAARVGTVSAIGYLAFLAGPPLLGLLGDLVGLRLALLVVLAFVLLSFFTSPVARERGTTIKENA
ncbi:MFS transporter [Agrococcus sp. ProA11]|uniref:MFS transporter n=1 Tax=Agrococcus chionoecetis TaxID=3153752 RepID=UPI003260FAD8